MTDKGSKKPVNKLEDVTEIDDLDVPTTNVYTRTGKAAPTEVLPSTPKTQTQPASTAAETDAGEKSAKPAKTVKSAKSSKVARTAEPEASGTGGSTTARTVSTEPVAASTVSTAGTLHTTEAAEDIGTDSTLDTDSAKTAQRDPQEQAPVGRGTIDVGLLILRLVVGGILICTSLAVLFQLGGNDGLAGLEDQLASHAYPRALAIALPTMGLASGVFLVLGLLTPVAAMVAVAATGFGAVEALSGSEAATDVFAWEPSVWLAVAMLGMALAVQFTGPGVIGVDFNRSWTRRPMASSWLCAAIGIAGAVLLWIFA